MDNTQEQSPETSKSVAPSHETQLERVVAFVVCAVIMLLPMIYIEHGYDAFTAKHGEAREGAAGAGLALAIVFRTVSRTVLRTIVRTSARAGVRASLKGAMKTAARTAIKAHTKTLVQTDEMQLSPAEQSKRNWKSLFFASGLLYASWVIVVIFGQPFANLLNKEDSIAREAQVEREHKELREKMELPAIEAWQRKQELEQADKQLEDLRQQLKSERDPAKQGELTQQIALQKDIVYDANYEFGQAFEQSNGLMLDPSADQQEDTVAEDDSVGQTIQYLMTYAPYPGTTPIASPVVWMGGLVMVLPLWVIFFVQTWASRQKNAVLDLQTEWIGGSIQLYFAGAFSFMPLTSDVVINTTPQNRSWIASWGLAVPTVIALALWCTWKQTQITPILFAADAFLLYPMVQVFPLAPLEGVYVWRWSKVQWSFWFLIIMAMFMLMSSEALKNVI